jgi:hypothetical protein
MSDSGSVPVRMILPPDGRQTRIDFFSSRHVRKQSPDWWNTISSWFRQEEADSGPDLDFFDQQLRKEGYSEKSRRSYIFMMRRFIDYFEGRLPRDITMGDIEDYNFEFFVSGRYSRSYQLQFINAIKLYYSLTEGIELNLRNLTKTGVGRR